MGVCVMYVCMCLHVQNQYSFRVLKCQKLKIYVRPGWQSVTS